MVVFKKKSKKKCLGTMVDATAGLLPVWTNAFVSKSVLIIWVKDFAKQTHASVGRGSLTSMQTCVCMKYGTEVVSSICSVLKHFATISWSYSYSSAS